MNPLYLVTLSLLVGCAAPPGPIFPRVEPPIVWPAPPDQARIRYVGQLSGEANLGVKPRGWTALRAVLQGPTPTTAFSTPNAVAVDGERIYVTDAELGVVHVLDLAARTFSLIRQAAGEPLQGPLDVVVCDGSLAVADSRRAAVFLFDPRGAFLRTIGAAELQRPVALAWDGAAQDLYVLDAPAHRCAVFGLDGALRRRIGGAGDGPGQFRLPTGVAWRVSVGLVIADAMNFRVQIIDSGGRLISVFGKKGDAAGDFSRPRDVAVDSDGHIYVLDNQFENVQVFDRTGQLLLAFGREGDGPGQFALPSGITIDERDRIWIADTYNRRVQVFQYLTEDAS